MSRDKTTGREPRVSEEPHDDDREVYAKPKLAYVRPELVKRGDVAKVTAGFFGTFSP